MCEWQGQGLDRDWSDPVRLEIVARLDRTESEHCGDITASRSGETAGWTDHIDRHESTLSHHYRALREARVTDQHC